MRLIVTGGCGFIGSNLVERLVKEDHEVKVFDNLHTGNLKNLEGILKEKDIFTKTLSGPYSSMEDLVPNAKVIFHLGIPSSSPMYKEDRHYFGWAINDMIDVLEYCKKYNAKLILASSSSLYNGNIGPYTEDMTIKVTDFYTECRYSMERLCQLYNELYGLNIVAMRFFSVYGPKETFKGKYANMVSQFLWMIRNRVTPVIYGDGTQTRDFIHVSDVVQALILVMEKDFPKFEVFNVGTGIAKSFNDVIDILNDLLGTKIKPKYVENPIKNYVPDTLANTKKAEDLLGFKAKLTLREGIETIL